MSIYLVAPSQTFVTVVSMMALEPVIVNMSLVLMRHGTLPELSGAGPYPTTQSALLGCPKTTHPESAG